MSEQPSTDPQSTSFTHALMIELDYVAVSLRPVEFAAIKRGIEPKGIELTTVAFSRSPLSPDHRTAVTDILKAAGNKADAIEKAVGEVDKSVKNFIQQEAQPNAALNKLVEAAQKRGVAVFAYSALDQDDADVLMEKLGLHERGVSLLIPEEQRETFPRADDWLKMLKQVDIDTKTVVAVVSSQLACKGALTAGAAVISIPDEYTHFQDFSGSAFVLDSLSDQKPDLLLDKTLRM
jgi:beta-phosphoglucomutase-like phosphatase (HAD superfamily)|tara:strand:- start:8574 stop:9278 length:705 start_codon:yes stop_codon:yes gene_type:complete